MYNQLHKYRVSHYISRRFLTMTFPPFRWLYYLFCKIRLAKTQKRFGKTYRVLLQNGIGAMNFLSGYENWLDEMLPHLIEKDQAVFVDIGANTGQTMLKVLPRFPGVAYYAVEPNPKCAEYLKELCSLNDFLNVKILYKNLNQ